MNGTGKFCEYSNVLQMFKCEKLSSRIFQKQPKVTDIKLENHLKTRTFYLRTTLPSHAAEKHIKKES